jgi:hypothetical protein
MCGYLDLERNSYTACTPVRDGDDPDELGLLLGRLPGGTFLRGWLIGEVLQLSERIGLGMAQLEAGADLDRDRPLVGYYCMHNEIELWVPIIDH